MVSSQLIYLLNAESILLEVNERGFFFKFDIGNISGVKTKMKCNIQLISQRSINLIIKLAFHT